MQAALSSVTPRRAFVCNTIALQPCECQGLLAPPVQAYLCLTMLRRNRLTADLYTRGIHCPSGWLRIFRVITWMLRRSASCTKDFLSAVGESTTHQPAVIKKRQCLANTNLYAYNLESLPVHCSRQRTRPKRYPPENRLNSILKQLLCPVPGGLAQAIGQQPTQTFNDLA